MTSVKNKERSRDYHSTGQVYCVPQNLVLSDLTETNYCRRESYCRHVWIRENADSCVVFVALMSTVIKLIRKICQFHFALVSRNPSQSRWHIQSLYCMIRCHMLHNFSIIDRFFMLHWYTLFLLRVFFLPLLEVSKSCAVLEIVWWIYKTVHTGLKQKCAEKKGKTASSNQSSLHWLSTNFRLCGHSWYGEIIKANMTRCWM